METKELIVIEEFCKSHDIPVSFFDSLNEYSLVKIVRLEEQECVPVSDLPTIEKMMRLHYDMQVNFEGIDIITNLLRDIEAMQSELKELRNRVRFFEG